MEKQQGQTIETWENFSADQINTCTQLTLFKHVDFYAPVLLNFLYQINAHQLKSMFNDLS